MISILFIIFKTKIIIHHLYLLLHYFNSYLKQYNLIFMIFYYIIFLLLYYFNIQNKKKYNSYLHM